MTKNLRDLIEQKRQWSKPLSEEAAARGFRGWRSRGYLPHFDAPGILQMITYRLADAMPSSQRSEWEALLAIEAERSRRIQIETYLDAGFGDCILRNAAVAELVQENLLHFDGDRYRLLAWSIMPNHVHALIEILDTPLDEVLHDGNPIRARRSSVCSIVPGSYGSPNTSTGLFVTRSICGKQFDTSRTIR